MTLERDIQRAEGEGMVSSEVPIEPELKFFLEEVKNKFDEDENVWGLNEAASAVISQKNSGELKTIASAVRRNFLVKKDLSGKNLELFLQKDGALSFENHMRLLVGELEWERMEKTSALRVMKHDITFGGTPG
jgi:hypothetical protein